MDVSLGMGHRQEHQPTESILKKLGNIESLPWLSDSYGKLQRPHVTNISWGKSSC